MSKDRVKHVQRVWLRTQLLTAGKLVEATVLVFQQLRCQLRGKFGDFNFALFFQGGSPFALVGQVGTSNHSGGVNPRQF